ncbi:MAG TPA: NAD-dependent epimerase/dehydratase family protein [Gemmatimonadales bacterium]|nr:NAD-dependent epimerase/dehydratase family protein [Gemmatimonadales bacterium]
MNVLVTGADGFVGRVLVGRLRDAGHAVTACFRAGAAAPGWPEAAGVRWLPLELADAASVAEVADDPSEHVVHLAGLASGAAARRDPGLAWEVNAAGTARLLEALSARPRRAVLVVSTGELYGPGPERPRTERDPVRPVSPYASSKAGAELAGLETMRRTGIPVIVARPFPHTGPGQTVHFVAPAFAARLAEAKRAGATEVMTGPLDPVRDLLDVRDVAEAYRLLLERGVAGEAYNVASGAGLGLRDLFDRLAAIVGVPAVPRTDPALARAADIPHLVGDAGKLREATGWAPVIPIHQTLQDLVDAQAQ